MKKFFSLLCAVALVLSTTAAPQFKTFNPAAQPKVSVAKVVKPSEKKATASLKIKDKKELKAQASVRKLAKAPKAKQATANVNIVGFTAQYYSSYNDFIYVLVGENDLYYCFSFPSEGADPVVLGTTYTLADMDDYYSYWYDDNYDYADYTACTFKKTQDANGKVKIEATATDTNGDSWNLLYDEASLPNMPQGGSYVADQVEGVYYSSYSDIQYTLTFTEANLVFYFDFPLESGVKDIVSGQTYTLADMDTQYSAGYFAKVNEITYASASFTKTAAADGSYTIVASVTDTDGNTWNLSASKAAPQISYQTLVLNGTTEPGSSYSLIEAANADTTIYVSLFLYSSSLEGTYTEEDLITSYSLSYILFGGVEYDIEAANFTVAYSEQAGAYIVSGTVNGVDPDNAANQVIFTLDLTCAGDAPAAQSDMTFQFQLTDSSIIVKPSNNEELWDWYMADSATLDYYGADNIASAIYKNYGTKYATSGQFEMTFDYLYGQGYTAGQQNLIVWGCDANGVTTPAATFTFELPEQEFVSDMTFEFQANDSSIIVTPSDLEALWDFYVIDSATYSYNCGNNPDFVASVIYENNGVKNATKGSDSIFIEQLVKAGYSGRVIIIAWGCDSNQVTTKAAEFAFTLPKKVSDMTFQFQPFDGGVTVIPSNDEDPWDLAIITTETFASVGNDADFVAEYFYSENGDDNAYPGAYDVNFADFGVTEDGSYVLIVWGADGGVTTPAAVYTFSIGGTTAIDEIDAAVKANKVIRDGQFFIEKGSVRFNANGILVK